MHLRQPKQHRNELDYGDEMWPTFGTATSNESHLELPEREQRKLRKERQEALDRKRPCGFQAVWPDQEGHE